MADYNRYHGSKEKIGITLSTTDGTNFVVQSAAVTITGSYYRGTTKTYNECVSKAPCTIDNQTNQPSHLIEYLFFCDENKVSSGLNTAEFAATLSDGQVVVRSVTINVQRA
ncbi:MAG: hypothetical protein V4671_06740 [Armatimonadota bacterium]